MQAAIDLGTLGLGWLTAHDTEKWGKPPTRARRDPPGPVDLWPVQVHLAYVIEFRCQRRTDWGDNRYLWLRYTQAAVIGSSDIQLS